MFRLKGIIPPMITPFDEYGELDIKNLITLVEYLSEHVDGVFICGSYGCGPLMSVEERKKVAEIVKQYASDKLQVVVHTGCTTAKDTIELSLHAKDIGCDAVSAVGPFYFQYGDKDLIHYYEEIIKALGDFPLYIYHNPKFQGYETSLNVIKTLKEMGLSGVKDATFNIMTYAAYQRELADENFDIALGTEAMWVSAYALGCEAFIPGIANVLPEICRKMYNESLNGQHEESVKTQFEINKIREIMYLARSTQLAIYAIAKIRGIIDAYPRSPFIPATDEETGKIRAALTEMGAI